MNHHEPIREMNFVLGSKKDIILSTRCTSNKDIGVDSAARIWSLILKPIQRHQDLQTHQAQGCKNRKQKFFKWITTCNHKKAYFLPQVSRSVHSGFEVSSSIYWIYNTVCGSISNPQGFGCSHPNCCAGRRSVGREVKSILRLCLPQWIRYHLPSPSPAMREEVQYSQPVTMEYFHIKDSASTSTDGKLGAQQRW